MRGETHEWLRVDNTGCGPWMLRVFLLAWAIMLPYAVMTGSKGWFGWSLGCVMLGVWLTLRHRGQRAFAIPEMTVEVAPNDLRPGEPFQVTLQVGGDEARTIRWWSAEMMAVVADDDPKPMVKAEFAIDPEAEAAPVSELQMVLEAPGTAALHDAEGEGWFVQVTVETDRGRMESGRVPVRIRLG